MLQQFKYPHGVPDEANGEGWAHFREDESQKDGYDAYLVNSDEYTNEYHRRVGRFWRSWIGAAGAVGVASVVTALGVHTASHETVDAQFTTSPSSPQPDRPTPTAAPAEASAAIQKQDAVIEAQKQRVIQTTQELKRAHKRIEGLSTKIQDIRASSAGKSVSISALKAERDSLRREVARDEASLAEKPKVQVVEKPVYKCIAIVDVIKRQSGFIDCDDDMVKNAQLNQDGKPYNIAEIVALLTQSMQSIFPEQPSATPTPDPSESPSPSVEPNPSATPTPAAPTPSAPANPTTGKSYTAKEAGIKIMSDNVHGSSHTKGKGHNMSGPVRMDDNVDYIKSENPDVVAFQELQPNQYAVAYKRLHDRYYFCPDNVSGKHFSENTIIASLSRFGNFTCVAAARDYFGGSTGRMPNLTATDKVTGLKEEFDSRHYPAETDFSKHNFWSRHQDAVDDHQHAVEKQKADEDLFVIGDLNSRPRPNKKKDYQMNKPEQAIPCVLQQTDGQGKQALKSAYNIFTSQKGVCPPLDGPGKSLIDWVLGPPDMLVLDFNVSRELMHDGKRTDHPTIDTTVVSGRALAGIKDAN